MSQSGIRLLLISIFGILASIDLMLIDSKTKEDICSPIPQNSALMAQALTRISVGEKSLFGRTSPEKQAALKFIEEKKYDQAVSQLEKFIKNNPNDPEALIFLNNARINDNKLHSYTIAVAVPIEKNPGAAEEILRGVALAQNEINNSTDFATKAQGLYGVKLKVAIANDSSQKEITENIANSLANQKFDGENILGVVGHFTTDSTKIAGDVYKCAKEKLVAISPTSTSIKLIDDNPYIFTVSPNDQLEASALALHMAALNKTKVAIFYNSSSEYSKSLRSQFQAAVESQGGKVLDPDSPEFNINNKQNNLKRLAKAKDAEVLMFATTNVDIESVLGIIENNKKKLILLGGDGFYDPDIFKDREHNGVAEAEGMVIAVPWHKDMASATNFVKNFQRLWGQIDVNWRTAMAYDATEAFIEALRLINKESPLRKEVRQQLAMENFSANAAVGLVQFERSQDRKAVFKLVKICRAKSNQYDFVPIEKCPRS